MASLRVLSLMAAGLVLGSAGTTTHSAAAPNADSSCSALVGNRSLPQTEIKMATSVAATTGLPAYCEVQAMIRPEPGSQIGVVYRLPPDWNGKLLALGGGGWMGNVTLQAAQEGLTRGYAVLQTDAGHANGSGFDASPWAINADGSTNRVKLEDFSHRAIHLMTERGKQLIRIYYGKQASRAYYQGCSTGGRMGMMETQRYPEDFDGVIAGAPVYTLQTQTSQQLRSQAFDASGARLSAAQVSLVHAKVLEACDAADGAADGVLREPKACGFDPGVLQCTAGQTGDACLTSAQVTALRTVYNGQKARDGSTAAYPLEKGGESGWMAFVPATRAGDPGNNSGGMYALRGPLLGDASFDMSRFTPNDVLKVRSSWLAGVYEAKDPDISAFVRRGGKLLLYHGFSDPGPSARATIEYFEAAMKKTRGAGDAMRLFIEPGMGHCRGGDGPDRVEWLTALEKWVEKGQAPEELPASKANSTLAWNVCAWPKLPTGQPDGSYACR